MQTEKITLNDLEKILENYKYLDIQIERLNISMSYLLMEYKIEEVYGINKIFKLLGKSNEINKAMDKIDKIMDKKDKIMDKKEKQKNIIDNALLVLDELEKVIIKSSYFSFGKITIKELTIITNLSKATICRKKKEALSKLLNEFNKNSNFNYISTQTKYTGELEIEELCRLKLQELDSLFQQIYKTNYHTLDFGTQTIIRICRVNIIIGAKKAEKSIIENAFAILDDLEKEIVNLVYLSREKILGKEITYLTNVSRASIYRIKEKALNKLSIALLD